MPQPHNSQNEKLVSSGAVCVLCGKYEVKSASDFFQHLIAGCIADYGVSKAKSSWDTFVESQYQALLQARQKAEEAQQNVTAKAEIGDGVAKAENPPPKTENKVEKEESETTDEDEEEYTDSSESDEEEDENEEKEQEEEWIEVRRPVKPPRTRPANPTQRRIQQLQRVFDTRRAFYKEDTRIRPETVLRLLRDWKQLQEEPLSTVAAAPVSEDNILVWHCNLRPAFGPYAGVTFHLELTFLVDYPISPPALNLMTPLEHPNVFGHWVCLDMLRVYMKQTPYKGWSSAYTVQSILLQLQSFLLAENIPQDYGYDARQINDVQSVDKTKEEIDKFVCKICGHCYNNPFPPLPDLSQDETLGGSEIPPETLSEIWIEPSNKLNSKDASPELILSKDGLSVRSEQQKGWFGVRAEKGYIIGSKPRSCYFEVYIKGTGVSRVGFSLSRADYNLGTDFKGWGFGGTAKKSHRNKFTDYGAGFRKGDVIGCALDLVTGNIVFFKNGLCLGVAFTVEESLRNRKFFPTVAMRSMELTVNFGPNFKYVPPQFKKRGGAEKLKTPFVSKGKPGGYILDIKVDGKQNRVVYNTRKEIVHDVAPEQKKKEEMPTGPNYFEKLPRDVIAVGQLNSCT